MRNLGRFVAVALLFIAEPLFAEPLIQTLPADGAWASYHVTMKQQEIETTPTWFLRSVGGKVVDGRKCRWMNWRKACVGRWRASVSRWGRSRRSLWRVLDRVCAFQVR